jgi:hypothetical protein
MSFFRSVELTLAVILHIVYRFIQMIFALAVCGLYGADLHNANKHHVPSDSKWVRTLFPQLFQVGILTDCLITGLCRSRWVPQCYLRPRLHDTDHRFHPAAFHLGHNPIHLLDCCLWRLWQSLHPYGPTG